MRPKLDDAGLDLLFRRARTQNGWLATEARAGKGRPPDGAPPVPAPRLTE